MRACLRNALSCSRASAEASIGAGFSESGRPDSGNTTLTLNRGLFALLRSPEPLFAGIGGGMPNLPARSLRSALQTSGWLRVHRDAIRDLWVGTLPASRPPLEAQVGDVCDKYLGIHLVKSPSLNRLESVLGYSEVRGHLLRASPQHGSLLLAAPRKRPETHRILQARTVGVRHTHELLSEKNSNSLDGVPDFLVGEDRCDAYPTAGHLASGDQAVSCNRLFGADHAL